MHESVLIYKILDEIKPKLTKEYLLKTVLLDVGEFSCVNTRTLTRLFDLAKNGTFAAGSKLRFNVVKNDSDVFIKSIEVDTAR